MTYKTHRDHLHKLMISYLRFMKLADTDEQLLELNTEVNTLRNQIDYYDQFTASQMVETVNFSEEVYESDGFLKVFFTTPSGSYEPSVSTSKRGKILPKSKYIGISWSVSHGKYVSTITYKGKKMHHGYYNDEKEAVIARDRVIIKYYLPMPLQILTKNDK